MNEKKKIFNILFYNIMLSMSCKIETESTNRLTLPQSRVTEFNQFDVNGFENINLDLRKMSKKMSCTIKSRSPNPKELVIFLT